MPITTLIQLGTADIYVLNLAQDAVQKIVAQPGPDANPRWSPDGKQIGRLTCRLG